jgi:hypothetical protein
MISGACGRPTKVTRLFEMFKFLFCVVGRDCSIEEETARTDFAPSQPMTMHPRACKVGMGMLHTLHGIYTSTVQQIIVSSV